jgi:hypothetical protein
MGRGRQPVPGASKYAVSKPAAGRGPGSLAGAAVPAGSIGAVAVKPAAAVAAGGVALFSPPATSAPSSSTASTKQQGPGAALAVRGETAIPSTGGAGKVGSDISPLSNQPTASRNNVAPDPGGASDRSADQKGLDLKGKSESLSKSAAGIGKALDNGSAAAAPSASLVGIKGEVSSSKESAGSSALPAHNVESSAAADATDPKQRGRWSPCDK